MAKRLSREELVETVGHILRPKGFTAQEINEKLLLFAINCPDPAAAMDFIIEPGGPTTAEGIVAQALALPNRDPKTLPESQLHRSHPLRTMTLEEEEKGGGK